jgi:hypothetical protein
MNGVTVEFLDDDYLPGDDEDLAPDLAHDVLSDLSAALL